MKPWILSLLGLISSAQEVAPPDDSVFAMPAAVESAEPGRALNLLEIQLGPGDHPGFDIAWPNSRPDSPRENYDPTAYDGIRFVGAGADWTHVRGHVGSVRSNPGTIMIGPDAGVVEFVGLTVHVASGDFRGRAVHAGLERRAGFRPLLVRLDRSAIVTDTPAAGERTSGRWGLFTYQASVELIESRFDGYHLSEHPVYLHGYGAQVGPFLRPGLYAYRTHFERAGAECLKVTARPDEVFWVPDALIYFRESSAARFHQLWSDRGGGGLVCQGTGADILVEDSMFWGRGPLGDLRPNPRCIMVDDSGTRYYGPGGTPGFGPANGLVGINRSGVTGGPGPDWYAPTIRVGTLQNPAFWPGAVTDDKGQIVTPGTHPPVAKAFVMLNSGAYGANLKVELGGVARVLVADCNTPALASIGDAMGLQIEHDPAIFLHRGPSSTVSAGIDWRR